MNTGPASRLNLGFGYLPATGLSVNFTASHSSAHTTTLVHPADPMREADMLPAGNSMLLQGQAGYRIALGQNESLEFRMIIRTPLTGRLREWAGVPMPDHMVADNRADSGGKPLVRFVQFYLRSGF